MAVDSKQWVMGASTHHTNCSRLENKDQFTELKGRAGRGERYERKKLEIVMEELAIMNPFLIPPWHMLASSNTSSEINPCTSAEIH